MFIYLFLFFAFILLCCVVFEYFIFVSLFRFVLLYFFSFGAYPVSFPYLQVLFLFILVIFICHFLYRHVIITYATTTTLKHAKSIWYGNEMNEPSENLLRFRHRKCRTKKTVTGDQTNGAHYFFLSLIKLSVMCNLFFFSSVHFLQCPKKKK